MAKGVYIGAENFTPVSLPSGYTQLKYIESDGAQFIDTGIVADTNTSLVMNFDWLGTNTAWMTIFGSYDSNNYFSIWHQNSSDFLAYIGTSNYKITDSSLNLTLELSASKFKINSTEVTYSCTISATNPLYLFHISSGQDSYAKAVMRLYSCKIYSGSTLIRNFIPVKNSSGTVGLYDLVSSTFFTNAGTGSFASGPVHGDVAHKVKKIYLGIDNVAHKVKKGYIGIGWVARPIFSSAGIEYYGTITALSVARRQARAANVGNNILFGGGQTYSGSVKTVDAYSASLTRSTPSELSYSGYNFASMNIGNYALYAGGYNSTISSTVDAYNTSLTKTTAPSLSTARTEPASALVGDYGMFACGNKGGTSGTRMTAATDVYNKSLTLVKAFNAYSAIATAGATIDGYAIIGGGLYSSSTILDTVKAYNASLTYNSAPSLSTARYGIVTANAGKYALFIGGQLLSLAYSNVVDAYSPSLTRTIAPSLSVTTYRHAATSLGNFALVALGRVNDSTILNTIEMYDESLTKSIAPSLSQARWGAAGGAIGDKALFAGGQVDSAVSNVVDAYLLTA